MTTTTDHNERPSFRQPMLRALHVVTLCAFAFTEPLLDALARQTVYLHDEQIGVRELSATLLVLVIVIPTLFVLLDRIAQYGASRIVGRFAGRGRNVMLTVLSFLVALSCLRPTARWDILAFNDTAWLFSFAVAIPSTWLFINSYERRAGFRRWLTVSAMGVIVFPLAFLWQIWHAQQQDQAIHNARIRIENPIPVVMVIFDEFSGTSVMNERLEVDAARLPNLARLAASSTWYRQASSVHARTGFAVPAIMSGRFPATPSSPLLADHPNNLLEIIHNSGAYDMSVFEPVTRLCPEELAHNVERTPPPVAQRVSSLLQTLARVYPHLVFPSDIPVEFPEVPKPWFGMRRELLMDLRRHKTGLFHYSFSSERDVQLDHFLDCVSPAERPPFRFLHVVFPHYPWTFYPSGKSYTNDTIARWKPDGGLGELGEHWLDDEALIRRNEHRYLMQVAMADRFVGQLLDRLQEIDLLDRCLLVVMADHGVSFRPSRSRRVPDGDNVTDLMSVPLFVKLPGQTVGRIDDSNVETIDVFPTITEELGITLNEPIDGLSLSKPERHSRKTFYYENGMTILEPRLLHLAEAVQRRLLAFRELSLDRPPRAACSRPEWIGRSLTDFILEEPAPASESPAFLTQGDGPQSYELTGNTLTSRLLEGQLAAHLFSDDANEVLITLDGVVFDASRTFASATSRCRFSFLLPESVGATGPTEIELFLVKSPIQNHPALVRLRRWTIGSDQ